MTTLKETNIDILKNEIIKLNYEVGSIDKDINNLTKKAVKEVIKNLDEEYTDVFVTIRKKLYVIEIATMYMKEKDINVYTGYKYFTKYGNLYEHYENEDITEEQYDYFVKMGLE